MLKNNKTTRSSDLWSNITIPDCMVLGPQKTGSGHGEAKLYIASRNDEEFLNFIDRTEHNRGAPFELRSYFLRDELLQFLEELKLEYKNPRQPYKESKKLSRLFEDRKTSLLTQQEVIPFTINEQPQIEGSRLYVKSKDSGWRWLRELALPNLSYLALIKKHDDISTIYHARLFVDFSKISSEVFHPSTVKDVDQETSLQAKFRQDVLKICSFCPLTRISDERLLEAAHIKPKHLLIDDDPDKWDKFNGMLLTPTMHMLYDRGFITIHNGYLELSPWLSESTFKRLGLNDGMKLDIPSLEKRAKFFEYHRKQIFHS